MEEEIVDAPQPAAELKPSDADSAQVISWIPAYLPATGDTPDAVAGLLDMLVTGQLSGLIAKPQASDEYDPDVWSEATQARPIAVVRPMAADEGGDGLGVRWILVVQVRGSGAGTVRRVASEIGTYVSR